MHRVTQNKLEHGPNDSVIVHLMPINLTYLYCLIRSHDIICVSEFVLFNIYFVW